MLVCIEVTRLTQSARSRNTNVDFMCGHRLRDWSSVEPALSQHWLSLLCLQGKDVLR